MADLSNKALALMLLVAIVVSLGGTMISLSRLGGTPTGRALNDIGNTNFTISSSASIIFTTDNINFGTGYVNGTKTACYMGTNATEPDQNGETGCIGFNLVLATGSTAKNLTIENDGNTRVNVSVNFTKNATGFIGGTSPLFKYHVDQSNETSCGSLRNASGNGNTNWKEVNYLDADNDTNVVCTNLDYADATDQFQIGIWIKVPEDATQTNHNVTIQATACQDNSCV